MDARQWLKAAANQGHPLQIAALNLVELSGKEGTPVERKLLYDNGNVEVEIVWAAPGMAVESIGRAGHDISLLVVRGNALVHRPVGEMLFEEGAHFVLDGDLTLRLEPVGDGPVLAVIHRARRPAAGEVDATRRGPRTRDTLG
ncbi:MAG: hypothetical protein GMKNLPBB_02898 [Myxococcota bacterium]|nr:hypothetical protein [Myxococcota bacterium]